MTTRTWHMGLAGNSIFIKLNGYDPHLNKELKAALPGPCKWESDSGWFEFPLHWDTCTGARKMANKWDAKLVIFSSLVEWAKNEKQRRAEIPDVQSMELTDLPIVRQSYPAIWAAVKSRPFQTVGAAFAARNHSCLIADQPGLGKTVQSIAAIIEADIKGPILVVAPKAAAKLTWPQELARWVPDDGVFVLGSHLKPQERKDDLYDVVAMAEHNSPQTGSRYWVITSPNYLRIKAKVDQYGKYERDSKCNKQIQAVGETVMELFGVTWSSVIVDESHQTLAGASGDKKKQSAQRVGLGALDVRDDGLRLALSGTPFRGKEEYLWGQLNWLRPDLYRSRLRWLNEFFDIGSNGFGMIVGGAKNRAEIYKDASRVMIRRTKAEVAKDLPPKMYGGWPLDPKRPEHNVAVWLDMDPKQAKAYEDIQKKAEAELEGGTLMTMGVLSELTRLKQFACSYGYLGAENQVFRPSLPSNKFDWLVEFLDERGIEASAYNKPNIKPYQDAPKIVVASQFSQLIDAFEMGLAQLGINTYKFTGSTSDKEREVIRDDWQLHPNSAIRVLLLTTTAGGVSLTLDAADELVILDETWDSSQQEQLEDRLHRLSRMHQVTIWKVFSKGTIEEAIARVNIERETSIKSIIDGSRGQEFAKKLLHR